MSMANEIHETDKDIQTFSFLPNEKYKRLKELNEIKIKSPTGEEIGSTKLDIAHFIGKGDTSFVLKTENNKTIKIPLDISENNQKIFSDEATLHIKMQHPNIVKVYGIGKIEVTSDTTLPCLIEECIPNNLGRDLEIGKVITTDEALEMAKQLSSALTAIYSETGEIISDLTPSNIGQREDNSWVVQDIGLTAKENKKDLSGFDYKYSAFEVIPKGIDDNTESISEVNNKASQAAMVYSLSLILWESISGKRINSLDEMDIAMDNDSREIHQTPELSDEVFAVLKKASSKNPENRYQTLGEFVKELSRAVHINQPGYRTSDYDRE